MGTTDDPYMSYITWGSKNCAVSEVSYVRVEGTWALDVVVEVLGGPVVAVVLVELVLVMLVLVVLVLGALVARKYAAPAAATRITITIRTAAILPIPRFCRRRSIPPESGKTLL